MSKYEVKDVVCDYGVFEDGELKLILNSYSRALEIVKILEKDQIHFTEFKEESYPPYLDRPKTNYLSNSMVDIAIQSIKHNTAKRIFNDVDGITDLFAKGLINELEMYDKLSTLKKKYTGEQTNA